MTFVNYRTRTFDLIYDLRMGKQYYNLSEFPKNCILYNDEEIYNTYTYRNVYT